MGIFSRARIFCLAIFIFISASAIAQPVLPDIAGASNKGINVISWTCQYEGIKSIAVQRSADSTYNYSTIGYVKNLKKGPQAFIDGHPLPGNNWYKLYIVFNSDLTWYSNRFKLMVDSATLMKKGVLPPNDSLQKFAAKIKIDSTGIIANPATPADSLQNLVNKLIISIPDPGEINAYTYIRSQYVFTNPFTGHINMEVPEPRAHVYSITFFDDKNKKILDVPRILEPSVILDKRNFQRKGLYKFELLKDNQKMETGYITIY